MLPFKVKNYIVIWSNFQTKARRVQKKLGGILIWRREKEKGEHFSTVLMAGGQKSFVSAAVQIWCGVSIPATLHPQLLTIATILFSYDNDKDAHKDKDKDKCSMSTRED